VLTSPLPCARRAYVASYGVALSLRMSRSKCSQRKVFESHPRVRDSNNQFERINELLSAGEGDIKRWAK